ncbi:MAG: hypothetical protein ACJ74H_20525 [Thermoanaerobaculia bacterium]
MLLLYIAAVAAVLMGIVHSTLGERLVFPRLFASQDLPRLRGSLEFTRSILRWAWHLLSLAWWGFAYLLFAVGAGHTPDAVTLARIIAVVFGVSGLIAFVTTRGRHIAWPLFALVALASWFGVE